MCIVEKDRSYVQYLVNKLCYQKGAIIKVFTCNKKLFTIVKVVYHGALRLVYTFKFALLSKVCRSVNLITYNNPVISVSKNIYHETNLDYADLAWLS